MTFSESLDSVLINNYAKAYGRASRSEYWWWQLFVIISNAFVFGVLELNSITPDGMWLGLLQIVFLLPNFCVTVRRCHDSGHSGWWAICPIINFIMMLLPSDPQENQYGKACK